MDNDEKGLRRKKLLIILRNIFIFHLFTIPLYFLYFPGIFTSIQSTIFSASESEIIISDYFSMKFSGFFLLLFFCSTAFIVSALFGLIHSNLAGDNTGKKPFKIAALIVFIIISFSVLPLSIFNFVALSGEGIIYQNVFRLARKEYRYNDVERMEIDRYAAVRSFIPVYEAVFYDGRKINFMITVPDQKIFNFVENHVPEKTVKKATSKGAEYFKKYFDDRTYQNLIYNYVIE
ncbi:MAG: hypothetical protein JW982_07300 [Spirochaetes bacterium]|nr:hypothetical protein [Spirochaetota bacterium]